MQDCNRYFMHPPWTPARQYKVPRTNFDTLWADAVPTVFQLMSGEDWNLVFYDCYRACGSDDLFCQAYTIAYFVLVTVLGNYVLLNILLAITLQNAQSEDDENEQMNEAAQDDGFEEDDANVSALLKAHTSIQPEVEQPQRRNRRRGIKLSNESKPVQPEAAKPHKRLSKRSSTLGIVSAMLGKVMAKRNRRYGKNGKRSNTRQMKSLERGAQQMKSLLASRKSRKHIVANTNTHKIRFCIKYAIVQPGFSYLYGAIVLVLV